MQQTPKLYSLNRERKQSVIVQTVADGGARYWAMVSVISVVVGIIWWVLQ